PQPVVDALELAEGDDLEISVTGSRMLEVARAPDAEALLARLRRLRGSLPTGFRFDRLEANERR
ncbi:AbrB family transcriptional regulator, partial [Escherichia coli]|nr:AbrB family transcriptional regulator [Escherichia coli]